MKQTSVTVGTCIKGEGPIKMDIGKRERRGKNRTEGRKDKSEVKVLYGRVQN
jgi:hypothetical protein